MVVESRSVAGRSEQEKKVILRAVLRVAQHELTGWTKSPPNADNAVHLMCNLTFLLEPKACIPARQLERTMVDPMHQLQLHAPFRNSPGRAAS